MKQIWPRFEQLPEDDRLWMLVWLGPFFIDPITPSQRSLLAVVVPLRESFAGFRGRKFPPTEAFELEHAREIPFGAGDLPALTLGMIFRQQRLLRTSWPYLRSSTGNVSFEVQTEISLQEAVDTGMLPQAELLLGGAWEVMKYSKCIGLSRSLTFSCTLTHPHTFLVPVAEILRWCYGSSSRMLQTVLSDSLGKVLEEVKRASRPALPLYHLHLPEGFPEVDAPTLAWLALDKRAAHAAEQVDLRLMTAMGRSTGRGEAYPIIPFPFEEVVSMKYIGRTFKNADEIPHTLVHRILQLDVPLPFGQVTLPRPSKESARTETTVPPFFSTSTSAEEPPVPVLRRGEPRRSSGVLMPIGPGTLFSHRDLIRYRHGEGTALQVEVRGRSQGSPGIEYSTAPGAEAQARPRRAVLSARRVRPEVRMDLESPIVSEDFERMRTALRILAARGVGVTELTLNNASGSEARFDDLLLEDGQRIGCIIAELHLHGLVLYVFEKQRLPGEHASTLVGRRADGRLAAEDELGGLLHHRAQRGAWPMKREDWLLRRLNHKFASPETLADGLLRAIRRLGGTVLRPLLG